MAQLNTQYTLSTYKYIKPGIYTNTHNTKVISFPLFFRTNEKYRRGRPASGNTSMSSASSAKIWSIFVLWSLITSYLAINEERSIEIWKISYIDSLNVLADASLIYRTTGWGGCVADVVLKADAYIPRRSRAA